MYQIYIRNAHDWFKNNLTCNFIFDITNNKITKIYYADEIIFPNDIPNDKSNDKFLENMVLLYRFQATTNEISNISQNDLNNLLNMIYDISVPENMQNLKFINLKMCNCNKGFCSAILDYEIEEIKFKTVKDVFKYYSFSKKENATLRIRKFKNDIVIIHNSKDESNNHIFKEIINIDNTNLYIKYWDINYIMV